MKVLFKKAKRYLNSLSRRVFIVAILTFLAASYLTVRAVFQEPAVAPSSSDQDFAENILGANNADNDYGSSSVAANRDGSIIERLEYAIGLISTPTCGNGSLEGGETCDDGGTSWTSGSCAGDCSRRNYWSSPKYAGGAIGAGTFSLAENANKYCQERGFRIATSNNTAAGDGGMNYRFLNNSTYLLGTVGTSQSSSSSNFVSSVGPSSTSYFYSYVSNYSYSISVTSSIFYPGWRNNSSQAGTTSSLISDIYTRSVRATSMYTDTGWTAFYSSLYFSTFLINRYYYYSITSLSQPSSNAIISEIWCAD